MPANLKSDPGRTLTLRRSFSLAIRRRLVNLAKVVVKFVDTDDSLGLKRSEIVTDLLNNADPGDIGSNTEKLAAFQKWFRDQVRKGILEVDADTDPKAPWTSEYVRKAYLKGSNKGYEQVKKQSKVTQELGVFASTKLQIVTEQFRASETVSKLELLAQRAYTKLKGITEEMDAEMTRILVEGLVGGTHPHKIAQEMVLRIKGMTEERANRIANTEIMYAHTEGQLDMFERLGIKEVGLEVEWLTAGDSRVCARCQAMAGSRMTIAQARGMIPLHPNCRCIWTPILI